MHRVLAVGAALVAIATAPPIVAGAQEASARDAAPSAVTDGGDASPAVAKAFVNYNEKERAYHEAP